MHTFLKEKTIVRKGVEFLVRRAIDDERVQLEEVNTGLVSVLTSLELLTEYINGDLLTAVQLKHCPYCPVCHSNSSLVLYIGHLRMSPR
jgi:hypothetical protein